jgi:DNA polymerase-3 subunit delta
MDASARKILTDLKAKKYAPVYVLQGEETYYIDLISKYIEDHTLSESEKGFNQVILYGKDVSMAQVLTQARRFPMMAERQVVIVREAQEIQDLNKETGSKLLLSYLKSPVPSTVLVLCHKHKTFDKRRELGKKIDQLAVSAVFKPPYENHLAEFVSEYAASRGVKIDDRAVGVLCEFVGSDLQRLANELEKVILSRKADESISADQVMAQVGISREYNVFELQRALVRKDKLLAAKIVQYVERNTRKNPVIPMVAFLYSFFSKLMAASLLGGGESSLASALKINPYAIKDYSAALRVYSPQKLAENLALLRQADLRLKGVNSGDMTEGEILKELVFRLM